MTKQAAADANGTTKCFYLWEKKHSKFSRSICACLCFFLLFSSSSSQMNHVSGVRNLHMAAQRKTYEYAKSICCAKTCSSGPPVNVKVLPLQPRNTARAQWADLLQLCRSHSSSGCDPMHFKILLRVRMLMLISPMCFINSKCPHSSNQL